MIKKSYHNELKNLMDDYAHKIYALTRNFPKEELYGITSQLRRSALSVILNYIEGYARFKTKTNLNFLEISYGSLQESRYLLKFSLKERYLGEDDYRQIESLADKIAAMLWGTLKGKKIDN